MMSQEIEYSHGRLATEPGLSGLVESAMGDSFTFIRGVSLESSRGTPLDCWALTQFRITSRGFCHVDRAFESSTKGWQSLENARGQPRAMEPVD